MAIAKRMDEPEKVTRYHWICRQHLSKQVVRALPMQRLTFDRLHIVRLVDRAFRDPHHPKNATHSRLRFWQDQFSQKYMNKRPLAKRLHS
ncbi:MAG: hypothetical protein MUF71_21910 [Candidatus Kapabacteria bacterium]|nr:hypothetical protein [Candidatus Kapabacteria bacterium]